MSSLTPFSRFRPLQEDAEVRPHADVFGEQVIVPPTWRAARGTPIAADGFGYSKFGWALAEVIAAQQGLEDPTEVGIGLVRMLEAASADDEHNINALARLRTHRTTKGVLRGAELRLFTPLVLPALTNGRALRSVLAALGTRVPVVTRGRAHPSLRLPRLDVGDAEVVRELDLMQDELLGLSSYQGENRDLIDSIIVNGVQEAPYVLPTHLSGRDQSSWSLLAYEGARRTFAAQAVLNGITGMSAKLWGLHWDGAHGERLRDITPDDFPSLSNRLGFPDAPLALRLPASARKRDVDAWRSGSDADDDHVRAFVNTLTMPAFVVVAVEPIPSTSDAVQNTVWDVVAEMVRSQHVRGKAKRMWEVRDIDGLAAIEAIDLLADRRRLTTAEKRVALGAELRRWNLAGDEVAWPSQLRRTVHLMALLVNRGERMKFVNTTLRDNGRNTSPTERARIAAAQAVATLGLTQARYEGQVAAALVATFNDSIFGEVRKHGSGTPWEELIDEPVDDLLRDALEEVADPSLRAGREAEGDFGPAQRALAALGITALAINPALIDADRQLTSTGRGGRGGVRKSDPSSLAQEMMQSPGGLRQLHAAVRATERTSPVIPLDPRGGEQLMEEHLRRTWLTPDAEPNPNDEMTPHEQWLADVDRLVAALGRLADDAKDIYYRREDDDDDGTQLLYRLGIGASTGQRVRERLETIRELFDTGRIVAATRGGRDA